MSLYCCRMEDYYHLFCPQTKTMNNQSCVATLSPKPNITSAKYLVLEALNTLDIAFGSRADICTELVQYLLLKLDFWPLRVEIQNSCRHHGWKQCGPRRIRLMPLSLVVFLPHHWPWHSSLDGNKGACSIMGWLTLDQRLNVAHTCRIQYLTKFKIQFKSLTPFVSIKNKKETATRIWSKNCRSLDHFHSQKASNKLQKLASRWRSRLWIAIGRLAFSREVTFLCKSGPVNHFATCATPFRHFRRFTSREVRTLLITAQKHPPKHEKHIGPLKQLNGINWNWSLTCWAKKQRVRWRWRLVWTETMNSPAKAFLLFETKCPTDTDFFVIQ